MTPVVGTPVVETTVVETTVVETAATTAVSYSVDPWDPSYGMAYGEELGG